MSEETDLETRLRALEQGERAKGSQSRRPSPAAIAAAGIGLVVCIGLLYSLLSSAPQEPLQTSEPDEFQLSGDGFGNFDPFPEPAPTPEPTETADPNQALLDMIEALQAEIQALQERPSETMDTSEQDAAMAELLEQLNRLERANAEAQAAFQRELRDRDQQLAQIKADLDLARLQGGAQPDMSEEDAALAELRRRQEEARAFQAARDASPFLAYSGGGATEQLSSAADRILDAGTDFVRNGATRAQVTQAEIVANPANTVPQGTLIQAALETAVDSSTPGQVRAITSENVYSYDGSRILIPRGSRLIGRYDSGVEIAQKRITIAWDRIILPTRQTVEISAFGGDELGRSGVTGYVDTRFGTRFGSAALISLITAGANYGAGQIEDRDGRRAASDMGSSLQNSTQTALNDYLRLGPIIRVEQGATVTVMVDRDLEIF